MGCIFAPIRKNTQVLKIDFMFTIIKNKYIQTPLEDHKDEENVSSKWSAYL